MDKRRPPIRVRFRYNEKTGEVYEFIVDANDPYASELYYHKVAHIIAKCLVAFPRIIDAGPIRPQRDFLPDAKFRVEAEICREDSVRHLKLAGDPTTDGPPPKPKKGQD